MASKPFQIPGLSTLSTTSQSQETQAGDDNSIQHDLATSGTENSAHGSGVSNDPLGSGMNLDTMDSQSGPHGSTSNPAAFAMELDQPEPAEQADNPSTSSAAMETEQVDSSEKLSTSVVEVVDTPPSPPSLTQGLEALLGGLDPSPNEMMVSPAEQHLVDEEQGVGMEDGEQQGDGQEQLEYEEDSSPYESSDSSSSDESDDEADSDDGKELLNPEEMARILMEAGSDDEGEGKAKGAASASQLRTKNELPEEPIAKPDVTITAEMKIEELGEIEHIVENNIVIKANTSGEYRVLDSGSVLCNGERAVIAALADLIGSVREPRYTARFTNEEEMKSFNLSLGSKIYYSPEHANFVFTEPLQAQKGTDASNLHDEEVVDEEVEFSDDEKEAAYKREQKEKKRARRGGLSSRGGRFGSYETSSVASSETFGLQYDDDEEDGPYRPLSRPSNFGQQSPTSTASAQSTPISHNGRGSNSGSYRGARGEFRGRGRGRPHDRGSRGNRGGSHGGSGYAQPPRAQGYAPQPPQQPYNHAYPVPPQFNGQAFPPPPPPQFYGASAGQQTQAPNHPYPFPTWPQSMPFVPPPPPQFQQQAQGAPSPNLLNPALYAALQSQFQGQNINSQQQPGQWPPHGSSG